MYSNTGELVNYGDTIGGAIMSSIGRLFGNHLLVNSLTSRDLCINMPPSVHFRTGSNLKKPAPLRKQIYWHQSLQNKKTVCPTNIHFINWCLTMSAMPLERQESFPGEFLTSAIVDSQYACKHS